ncbi:MAG: MBL fold metallo-hydrolase [Planctomycetales bacterium]
MNGPTKRRTWLAGGAVLVVIGLVLWSVRRQDPLRNVPLLDGTTTTIVPGIHLLGNVGPAAAYLVETSAGLVLIDAGLEADARQLKEEIARLGLDWKSIRAILLTHVHGDHCGGAEHLRAATGATVYASQEEADVLRAGAPREAFFSTFKMPDHAPHPTMVDVELEADQTIAVGEVRVRAIHAPGHTQGSTGFLVERHGVRALFSGDVIVRLGDKPLGTYMAYLAPKYRGDAGAYLATLENLKALPVPDLVLPGHPRSDARPQNPRMTRERWLGILDKGIREMQQLVGRYQTDGAGFLDGEPKRLLAGLYYLGDVDDQAWYGFSTGSQFFVVNAPGGPGSADRLRDRLRRLNLPEMPPTAVLLTACGAKETGGLWDLVERTGAKVVAPSAGLARVRGLCPPQTEVIPADALGEQEWFPVTLIDLGLEENGGLAYRIPWEGKTILFSAGLPTAGDRDGLAALQAAATQSRVRNAQFLGALRKLREVPPDVWLPARPMDGQNAHLYDRAWLDVIEQCFRAATSVRVE